MIHKKAAQTQGISYDTQTILTVITLIFVYPVGLILMYKWMNWGKGLKFILTIPVYLLMLMFLIGFLSVFNPKGSMEKGQCVAACRASGSTGTCVSECMNNLRRTSEMQNK